MKQVIYQIKVPIKMDTYNILLKLVFNKQKVHQFAIVNQNNV